MFVFYALFSALMIILAARSAYKLGKADERKVLFPEIDRWMGHYGRVASEVHHLKAQLVTMRFRVHDLEMKLKDQEDESCSLNEKKLL